MAGLGGIYFARQAYKRVDYKRTKEDRMSQVLHLDDANFTTTVNGSPTILVDFWASWCGPCRALGPTIEALSDEYAGRVAVAKVDVDKAPETAAKYRIQSIPAIVALRNGVEVGRVVGNAPQKVRELIEALAH